MENEEAQFTQALRKYFNTQSFYSVEEFIMLKTALIKLSALNNGFAYHLHTVRKILIILEIVYFAFFYS